MVLEPIVGGHVGSPGMESGESMEPPVPVLVEIDPDGGIHRYGVPWRSWVQVELSAVQDSSMVLIDQGSSGELLFDPQTGQAVELHLNHIRDLSPDGRHIARIVKRDKQRFLEVGAISSGKDPVTIPGVLDCIWISSWQLVVLWSDGRLGRYDIETGNETPYCVFNWEERR